MSTYEFVYIPHKLLEIKNRIISNSSNKAIVFEKNNDEEEKVMLLQKIDKTPFKDIRDLAFTLKNRELYLLIHYFAAADFNIDPNKFYEIIRLRFKKKFAALLWEQYQNNYYNKMYVYYFTKFCNEFKEVFVELFKDEKILQFIKVMIVNDDVIKSICVHISKTKLNIDKFFNTLKISEKLKLGMNIKKYFYLYCDKETYMSSDPQVILNAVKMYNQNELLRFIENYVGNIPFSELNYDIMEYILESKNIPESREKDFFWKDVSEPVWSKCRKWFLDNLMKKHLDGPRYNFWANYIDYIKNFVVVKKNNRNQAIYFIYFDEFVVVEFEPIGAAYIYRTDVFKRRFGAFASEDSSKSNSFFKDESIAIARIIHGGRWEFRAYNIVRQLLKGDWN
ncbi:hypothetical protein SAMN04244560_01256 [Thermoanaerobacter thermohydrosulfuricus]|uniref:EH_Signature domain-containing protein n=1 Tax=Thermoanaerobacter thermohydrosulfuricus TaxID=1516 RepID=A0A1G7P0Z9_THETY|nr:hypothetical protein [Thermoanaerobacter thermohydrosulfuricus]SDF79901.1 hypothetical protein SAMN04244560_01256 [Thermoanaerobacter thermohydrosulfuricus]